MSLLDTSAWPHTIDIARRVRANDDYGGDTFNDAAPYVSALPAWIQPASDSEIKEFASRGEAVKLRVFVDADPGIELGDIITVHTVQAGGAYDGFKLTPRSAAEATAGLDILFRMMCDIWRQNTPPATI